VAGIHQRASRSLSRIYYRLVTPFVAVFWFFIQRIPAGATKGLAPLIGHMILFGRKRKVIENMKHVLRHPDWDEYSWTKLWHKHVSHLGLTIAETMHHSRTPTEELRAYVAIQGDELLRTSLQKGLGAVILMNHVGNPGVVPFALALAGYRVSVAANVNPVQYLDIKLNQFLEQLGVTRVLVGENVVLTAENTLQNNGVFAAAIDHSATPNHTAWIEFGNAELQVSLVPAIIALLYRSSLFSAIVTPQGGGRYLISLLPIASGASNCELRDQALSITGKAIRGVSEAVERRPEQWWRWDYAHIREPGSRSANT
jgi:lauroyl/myristoyl acyltransferase